MLSLPSTLLSLLITSVLATTPGLEEAHIREEKGVSAWSGDKARLRRHIEIEERIAKQSPVAVRKMNADPAQKFWPEYWDFNLKEEQEILKNNATSRQSFIAPLLVHTSTSQSDAWNLFGGLSRRQNTGYQCSPGYSNCGGIGYLNSCCAGDYTCTVALDNTTGPVGCCQSGQDCVGAVSLCDTNAGYTSCPNSGWGCCIPGAICDDTGC